MWIKQFQESSKEIKNKRSGNLTLPITNPNVEQENEMVRSGTTLTVWEERNCESQHLTKKNVCGKMLLRISAVGKHTEKRNLLRYYIYIRRIIWVISQTMVFQNV